MAPGSLLAGFMAERIVNDSGDRPIMIPEGHGSPFPIHSGHSVSSESGSMKKGKKSGLKLPEKTNRDGREVHQKGMWVFDKITSRDDLFEK